MKTVFEHIEHVKGKPHHIRKQIGFALAGTIAAFIGVVWFTTSWYTGAFAIQGASFADAGKSPGVTSETSDSTAFAGAAAAIPSNAPAKIQIVDAASSTSNKKHTEQTTIPF